MPSILRGQRYSFMVNHIMKAILWDMDGTIVNTEHLWCDATYALAEEMGKPLIPEVRALTIGGTQEGTISLLSNYAGIPLTDASMQHWKGRIRSIMGELLAGDIEFRPQIPEILHEAHTEGLPMALVTNTTRDLTDIALASMYRKISEETFTFTLCGDEVDTGKPAPDIYLEAARRMRCKPDECLVVEDSSTGMRAAFTAGCRVIGIPVEEETVVPEEVTALDMLRPGAADLTGMGVKDLRNIYLQLG